MILCSFLALTLASHPNDGLTPKNFPNRTEILKPYLAANTPSEESDFYHPSISFQYPEFVPIPFAETIFNSSEYIAQEEIPTESSQPPSLFFEDDLELPNSRPDCWGVWRMTKTVTIQDLELPRNAIVKIIKNATDGKLLQKDAKTAVSRAATYFVSYLTAAAQEQTMAGGQKTITAQHLYTALEDMGWSEWIPMLKAQLEAHNNAVQMANRRKSNIKRESEIKPIDVTLEVTEEEEDGGVVEAILEPLSSTEDDDDEEEGAGIDDGDDTME